MPLKEYRFSFDYSEVVPITYDELLQIAFDANTSDEYSEYLQLVFEKAKECLASRNRTIYDFEFGIHENGCVLPFGEVLDHPYCVNFSTPWLIVTPDNDLQTKS